MIYSDSRYADGRVYKAYDSRSGNAQISVNRIFPSAETTFQVYVWRENDRLDVIAQRVYGSTAYWSVILDYNPEISNANTIPAGTSIRLPNV